jgi:hypothetical protein
MKNQNLAVGIRNSRLNGRPCFRWQSIGTNGQPVIRRVFKDVAFTINKWGFPEGENGPYEQAKI